MKKWLMSLMMLMLAFGILTGCGPADAPEQETEQAEPAVEETESQEETASAYPVTLVDALKNEVVIEAEPERIVTLVPSVTETVYGLGAGEKVVGRSEHDNFPAEVLEVESIGGMEFDIEKIISLQPDLVLAHESGVHSAGEGIEQLKAAGITVAVVQNAHSIGQAYGAMRFIGEAIGKQAEAEALISEMQAGFGAIVKQSQEISEEERQKVWFEIDPELWTTGQGTFQQDLLNIINATNIASEIEGWGQLSEEEIVAQNPDVIIGTWTYDESMVETIKSRSGWQDIAAIQNDRVHDIDTDIVSRPGPRLVEGVEQLAKLIYPEVFN
ncbi:ABC transporter substrate-binding protein [Bacillus alkalicellulosilyticus]|uniref:ABC transporter substrate-binding protein n=1 Tax=Alkalihalobacterium alkalicellulosilyticum TaxID=1912214 RepID=UPI000998643B|nr:ABC transporter substrate-binding protein [Bacillus alkalicellulosilyticus]